MLRRFIRFLATAIVSLTVILILSMIAFFIYADRNVDFRADELLFESARSHDSTTLYANIGSGESYTPIIAEQYGDYRKVSYSDEEIGRRLIDGFVAVEDREFYSHKGVNVKRTLRAAINYLTKKEKRFGASTITQQLIKNVSGDNEPTVSRKLTEILRAMRIEQRYSKDEIMELYLNVIPMSENIYGVGTAAKRYFGKEPYELSAAECATIIGITNAPSAYNPYNNPEKCMEKRNVVLSVMYREGVISEKEYSLSIGEPLGVLPREVTDEKYNSWFAEAVISDVIRDLAVRYKVSEGAARMMLSGGGYSIYTTMDTEVQSLLEKYFENEDNFSAEISSGLQYAMTIIDVKSGNLIATVGRVGKKAGNRLLSHAEIPHTPGSVLKPLGLYAPLIDSGEINWATVYDDVPCDFTESGGVYRPYPRNSPNIYSGLTTVKDAIKNSKNTVAVTLCKRRTSREVFNTLKNKFRLTTLVESEGNGQGGTLTDIAISPMALGQLTRGATLRELSAAFCSFASDGVIRAPRSYLYVLDKNGNETLRSEEQAERIMSEKTARIMNLLLCEVVDGGTAKSLNLKEKYSLAGKTGTSGNNRDKCFVGYTPYYTAGIWCGYESGGGNVASIAPSHLDVFDGVMSEIHALRAPKADKKFSTEGLLYLPYCKDSGKLYTDTCRYDVRGDRLEYGYFTADNRPSEECNRHILVEFDTVSKGISLGNCPHGALARVALIDVPERSFPTEVYIIDAEFAYRIPPSDIALDGNGAPPDSYPYFYYSLPEGVYSGISNKRRQFNAACGEHSH